MPGETESHPSGFSQYFRDTIGAASRPAPSMSSIPSKCGAETTTNSDRSALARFFDVGMQPSEVLLALNNMMRDLLWGISCNIETSTPKVKSCRKDDVKEFLRKEGRKGFQDDTWFNAVLQLAKDTNKVLCIRGDHGVHNLLAVAKKDMHLELTAEDVEKFVEAVDKGI